MNALPDDVAMSTRSRIAAEPNDAAVAVRALNSFGADLYALLMAEAPTNNLVLSPASIALALVMTSAGATDVTLAEIDRTLHIDDPTTIHRSMNALAQCLAARDRHGRGEAELGRVELSLVSSLWSQAGLVLEQPFLDLLAAEYGAGVNLVDYHAEPEAARARINRWVEAATSQRIRTLLPPGTVTPDTRLVLVNAIYLRADWQSPFSPGGTRPTMFTSSAGPTSVAMMHQTATFPYASGAGWRAVDLPYAGGELAMTIVIADEPGQSMDLAAVLAEMRPTRVRVGLPRFDIARSVSLAEALQTLGMRSAFDDDAHFTGITVAQPVHISEVVHHASITVDERGTEAAAATATVAATGPAPVDPPVQFIVDRPFQFALRDAATGAVLFLGRIEHPTAA